MTTANGLVLGFVLVTHLTAILAQPCPTDLCRCERGHPGKGRTINCRSRGLNGIPTFQRSDELFYELTLANKDNCYRCNNITQIPAHAFNGIKVSVIRFDKNPIDSVSRQAFDRLVLYLRELSLEGSGRHPPPYEALSRLTNLRKLSLKKFQQGSITRANTDLSRLSNLEELVLKNMDISYITNDAFQNRLPNLKRLRMEFLPLGNFPVLGLKPLRSLEELSAVYINLRRVPFGAFASFRNLKSLDISHNSIDYLAPGCFAGVDNTLEYLGLHLNKLDARNIGPLASPTWERLIQLNIGHNVLAKIPLGLFFNMRSLEYLNLDSNQITTVQSGSLQGLQNLTFLDFSGNMISSLAPGMFVQTPRLLELDLGGENSREFNLMAEGLRGLEETLTKLFLTNTRVIESKMWKAIQHLHRLQTLRLDGTRLTTIPDFQFVHNTHLEELMLQQNRISTINEKSLYGMSSSLKVLYLQGNQIQSVGRCVLRDLTSMDTLYLGGNLLNCDCRMRQLRNWILKKIAEDYIYMYIVDAYCNTPQKHKSKKLWDIPEEELTCDSAQEAENCDNITTHSPLLTDPQTTPIYLPNLPSTGNGTSLFRFTKIIETESGIRLDWVAQDDMQSGFKLEYQLLGKTSESTSVDMLSSSRYFVISDLDRNSHYLLCLRLLEPRLKALISSVHRTCIAVRTLP